MDHGEPSAFTIQEFCERHRISKSFYYELRKKGLAPAEMKVGRKRLISKESAIEWRHNMVNHPQENQS